MEFTVNKTDMRNNLSKIQGITGRKTNLGITEAVLIQTAENGVRLTATDMETGFEGEYSAEIISEGAIAINSRKLFEIVKDYPEEQIHLNEIENRWIQIGDQKVEYHIVGLDPETFPDVPKVDDTVFFGINSTALRKMIERTVIIVGASDDNRAHVNGVYLESVSDDSQKQLRMVSTDGSRLSAVNHPYERDDDLFETGVLIPKKGLNEVLKFLNTDETVSIGVNNNHFVVKKEGETLTIRLLEGDFPNYKDIITVREGSFKISLDRQLFIMMLRRMSILSSENYKGVIFTFESDNLAIRATNPELGESKEDMPIDYDGDLIEVAFNPKFFIDSLNVIKGETAAVHIISAESPCLIEGENDNSYISVIMPMKI